MMPRLNNPKTVKDPVGLMARAVEKRSQDWSYGKPDESDMVRYCEEAIGVRLTDEARENIAEILFDDCGVRYGDAHQMAAYVYARMVAEGVL